MAIVDPDLDTDWIHPWIGLNWIEMDWIRVSGNFIN